MKIEELDELENDRRNDGVKQLQIVRVDDAKRVLVGAGARILFYPTLLYNVFRNKIQSEFRWWDEVDQVSFYLLSFFNLILISPLHLSFIFFIIPKSVFIPFGDLLKTVTFRKQKRILYLCSVLPMRVFFVTILFY